MKKTILTLSAICFFILGKAQNIFPVKLDNCNTETFCLDCGDVKANVNTEAFASAIEDINKTTNFGNASGKILLQVLVDSIGNGCVLSHTDVSKSNITKNIISHFNAFKAWIPAMEAGKPIGRVSINVMVEVNNGSLKSYIQRVDMDAFDKAFDHPLNPQIFNKTYTYKNEHLKTYNFTVWNTKNSSYPDNSNDYLAVDNNNLIWFPTERGLMKFDGKNFTKAEHIVDSKKRISYYLLGIDDNNTKWTVRDTNIYSYDNSNWYAQSKQSLGLEELYYLHSSKNGELFFCTKNGLHIYKDRKWSIINNQNTKEIANGSVHYANRDSKGRLWIGTFRGSFMIDTDGRVISYNNGTTTLKGKCITSMDEGEDGNLYFGLYEYNAKDKKQVNRNEGIAIYTKNGEFKQLTTDNSGMPFNHVTKLLYDKAEKVLWIATDRAGLVRYDLKDGWENYHNQNSDIPTSFITNMVFDKSGVLYLATRQGLVRIQRKQ
ncbi:hypothetical protein ACFQZX_11390 [Mucilaginibacter litoreus]|uniref:Two component regulator propeller n=1 Tax=Mucilaginibacter litoreus TaxID=1048221 RepID=A0ABW3ATP4_9SPHI